MNDTPIKRKTFYCVVGFDEKQSGTIPINAISEDNARDLVSKLLSDKKNVEIYDIYSDTDLVDAKTSKPEVNHQNVVLPSFLSNPNNNQ